MAGRVMKSRRLANPGRRKMSAKQIKYFGTKRQKAALKAKRKRSASSGKRRSTGGHRSRRSNIGEIVSIGLNPGRSTSMARPRKRRTTRRKPRRNPASRVVTRYRYRSRPKRRNRGYRMTNRRRRRRNPNGNIFSSTAQKVLGVLGGAAVTKLIVDRLPYNLNTGLPSYIATGVVAVVQGMVVGKFGRNKNLGDAMTLGGFTYLALRLLQDFVPSVATISPIGLRGGGGMGVIAPSSFYNPQVPRNNAMTSFVRPAAIPMASAGMSGLGRRVARMGRIG